MCNVLFSPKLPYACLNPVSHITCCEISLKRRRQRKPASVRLALAAFSFAPLEPVI